MVSTSRVDCLAKRVLSVIVLLPFVLGLIYWGFWPVVFLTAAGIGIALLELYNVLRLVGYYPRFFAGMTSALFFCLAAVLDGILPTALAVDWVGVALAGSILLTLVTELVRREHHESLVNWALTLALACYISWLLSHYILLRALDVPLEGGWLAFLHIPSGAAWVYLVLAITWLSDTMAYFVGRAWGRHKMTPYLSPHKSWEGAAGGFAASVLIALLAVPLLGLPLWYGEALLLGVAGGLAGPLGDLAVSLLKRQIGLKDISNLIPGHGGMLDRIDSMLFTAPVLYYLILLLTVIT